MWNGFSPVSITLPSNQFGEYGGFHRWAADYPKSDRQFLVGVQRLTRIDTRPTGQILDADSDELFNYPWLYVEDAGRWRLSDQESARLREYLLRGGFLYADDTHGDDEWDIFMEGMHEIFPDRPVEDLKTTTKYFTSCTIWTIACKFPAPGLYGETAVTRR